MPNEHVMADSKRAFQCWMLFFVDVAGGFDSPCIVNVAQKKKGYRFRSAASLRPTMWLFFCSFCVKRT